MPIHREGSGWQWGQHGAIYSTRAGAEKQAAAAHAHGFHGDVMATLANAAIPAGLRKKSTFDEEGVRAHGAGIAFVEPSGCILLVRRNRSGDHAGEWAFPAGTVEDDEEPEEAARREAEEELGGTMEGRGLKLLDQRKMPDGLAFHTFAHAVDAPFQPKLNGESSGYVWAPLDQLPSPLHPGVEATLAERLGVTKDMTPEDWSGLRDGFLKWTLEEESEREHADDSDQVESVKIKFSGDECLPLAADEGSVRTKDMDGRLHISRSNISKADVNPYFGREIPLAEELGLDPNKIYQMLRPADELEKAASTANGIQILRKHTPVNAEDHKPYDTIGATGNDAEFIAPFLTNSLTFWPQDDIDDIESNAKKELSCGYRYRPEMTPGIFDGKAYDGIMRDIVFNHVALVENGRAGPEVVVGDSMENLMSKPTRFAYLALTGVAPLISTKLAKDAKIDLMPVFKDITRKNFDPKKVTMALDESLKGKLAKDADLNDVAELMHELAEMKPAESADESVSQPQHNAMEAAAHGHSNLGIPEKVGKEFEEKDKGKGFDAEPLTKFLKEKGINDEDIKKAMDMLPKAADAESEEDRMKREAEEKKAAEDKKARDEELAARPTKETMDAAIKLACDETAKATEKRVRQNMHEISAALDLVKPLVGAIEAPAMGFDSAEQIHRKALKMVGREDADTVHASALPTIIEVLAKQKTQQPAREHFAMDAAATKSLNDRFGVDRIGTA